MEPINKNLLKISLIFSLNMAKGNKRIRATIICINNKDRKLFNQLRKKPEVFLFNRHKKAKGDNSIKILAKIYLNVNVMMRLMDEIESIPVKRPSIEKILKLLLELPLSSLISEEKEIVFLKMLKPKPHIKLEIS